MDPVPSKIGCRMTAMRNALSGPLRREAIQDERHDLLGLAGPQFGQSGIQRGFASDLRMRGGEESSRLILILPDIFRHGDDSRQALRAFALSGTQALAPVFVRRFWNDAAHNCALLGSIHRDVPRPVRQPGSIRGESEREPPKCAPPPKNISDMPWFQISVSLYPKFIDQLIPLLGYSLRRHF